MSNLGSGMPSSSDRVIFRNQEDAVRIRNNHDREVQELQSRLDSAIKARLDIYSQSAHQFPNLANLETVQPGGLVEQFKHDTDVFEARYQDYYLPRSQELMKEYAKIFNEANPVRQFDAISLQEQVWQYVNETLPDTPTDAEMKLFRDLLISKGHSLEDFADAYSMNLRMTEWENNASGTVDVSLYDLVKHLENDAEEVVSIVSGL